MRSCPVAICFLIGTRKKNEVFFFRGEVGDGAHPGTVVGIYKGSHLRKIREPTLFLLLGLRAQSKQPPLLPYHVRINSRCDAVRAVPPLVACSPPRFQPPFPPLLPYPQCVLTCWTLRGGCHRSSHFPIEATGAAGRCFWTFEAVRLESLFEDVMRVAGARGSSLCYGGSVGPSVSRS